jgi:hypothetical protein
MCHSSLSGSLLNRWTLGLFSFISTKLQYHITYTIILCINVLMFFNSESLSLKIRIVKLYMFFILSNYSRMLSKKKIRTILIIRTPMLLQAHTCWVLFLGCGLSSLESTPLELSSLEARKLNLHISHHESLLTGST